MSFSYIQNIFTATSTPAATEHAEAWLWGATPRPKSGAATKSAKLWWHRRGREELPYIRGQGQLLRLVTQCLKSGVAAEKSNPTSKVRSSGCALLEQQTPREKQPHVQGKTNPSETGGVARGHQRAGTLNHNHRKLANVIQPSSLIFSNTYVTWY